ncbi:hypothetical protein MSG28_007305 [Choristoneura fumiferana]|uniref:Uncharacterized protein n=1 Tax=Choristoneura fumiferana TaxID=7141 RepID=A0ACC0JWY8_CHOFU|nr:hypothetical protein MSG28_007305 [Choristoneura fumiferana]
MLLLLFVAVPVLWVLLFRYRRRRMYELASKIPDGGLELPVIGAAHKFIGTTEVATDPVDLEMVLKTCLEKDDLHRFLRNIIGYGGIFAPVPIWRPRRKILLPAFSPKIVDSFVPVFVDQSRKLAEKLEERAGENKFSAWPFISSYTLDSVCETALGVKINAQGNDKSPFLVELNSILQLACERIFHLWLQPDWLYKLFPQHKKHEHSVKALHSFTNDVANPIVIIKYHKRSSALAARAKAAKEVLAKLGAAKRAGRKCGRYRRRRMYELASKIPDGGLELPVIGAAHKFIGTTEVATDPVDLEMVLKTCLEKDDLHRFLRNIIGYGGIFAPVPIWRPRRKILLPAFSPKIVDSFVPVFVDQSRKLAEKLEERAGENKFSAWPFISSYTLDSVCETALGVKINAQGNDKSPFLVELNSILQLACERIFHLWLQPDWLYKLFPQHKKHEHSVKALHSFTNDTFLDLLIHFSGGEKGYSNLELREEILTLTIAATDTSATAVGYTLKMLAKYPDIQQKVLQELDEVFGDSDRLFEKEDLMKLKYLERVVKETLRLFPPVPFIIRKVEEEVSLPSGRVLPAGSGVVVTIWGAHRDPHYWGPDAEQFDPDRFLPERFDLKHPCSYMPFSNGPRNCVGYQYALMSIKIALTSVLRSCRVVPDMEPSATPQIRVKLDIMMKAVDGYEIALERRK